MTKNQKPTATEYIPIEEISGLTYIPNFITEEEEERILDYLNQSPDWSGDIHRRTIQYGFKYDYIQQSIVSRMPDIPTELQYLVDRLNTYYTSPINQMIINEYAGDNQGIRKHRDFLDFGPIESS